MTRDGDGATVGAEAEAHMSAAYYINAYAVCVASTSYFSLLLIYVQYCMTSGSNRSLPQGTLASPPSAASPCAPPGADSEASRRSIWESETCENHLERNRRDLATAYTGCMTSRAASLAASLAPPPPPPPAPPVPPAPPPPPPAPFACLFHMGTVRLALLSCLFLAATYLLCHSLRP